MAHASAFTNTVRLTHQWRELWTSSSIQLKLVRKRSGLCQPSTTVDLYIRLPNDAIIQVPAHGTNSQPFPASRSLHNILQEGYTWFQKVRSILWEQTLEANEWISWAAYYASITEPPATPPTKSYMLPLSTESSNSPAMVWHGMKVLHQAISNINPGQTPVMVADQPLFTLAKKLQWKYPQTEHGEDSFLVTLGTMHTETMLWGVSGDWLDGSGWIKALTNSGISTSGKAQSFISVHHICRTRYMHQASVATLYMLMRKAYDQYVERTTNNYNGGLFTLSFDVWLKQLCVEQPQADYWFKSMELGLLILQFVKSCRHVAQLTSNYIWRHLILWCHGFSCWIILTMLGT